MGTGKKKPPKHNAKKEPSWTVNSSALARNLRTTDIGAVIFGCKHNTIQECYSNQLFGLPAPHFAYVRNVKPGLPLFLFNYSDRRLHGVFEAVSQGRLNINPYAWTDGSQYTPYEAQVRVRIVTQCNPLNEESFKPVIADNYYEERLFWFELDKVQTDKLMSLFFSNPRETYKKSPSLLQVSIGNKPPPLQGSVENKAEASYAAGSLINASLPEKKWSSLFKTSSNNEALSEASSNLHANVVWESGQPMHDSNWVDGSSFDGNDVYVNQEVEYISGEDSGVDTPRKFGTHAEDSGVDTPRKVETNGVVGSHDSKLQDDDLSEVREQSGAEFTLKELGESFNGLYSRLFEEVKELKICWSQQEQKISCLEQALVESKIQIQNLMHLNKQVKSCSLTSANCFEDNINGHEPIHDALIYIVGGFNGNTWLSSLSAYSPVYDEIKPLCSMPFLRTYASIAKHNGELFLLGGVNGDTWYDTVESYIPTSNIWVTRPSMNCKKESLAAVSLWDRMYALGGGNGLDSFSAVEILDLNAGRWITSQSMLQKRFDPAASESNGALYVAGGYDGTQYLSTAERFDPREGSWNSIRSMSMPRGCHSLSLLNGKLYAVGGYDGLKMVSAVEAFDPRLGLWMSVENMHGCRGSFGATVLGEKIYVIGGVGENDEILGTIECYEEGSGWNINDLKAIGKRGFFSSIVM